MKNKLFRDLVLIMLSIFLLTFLLSVYFFEINVKEYFVPVIALVTLFLVLIPISANILSHNIIGKSLGPLSAFLEYVTEILLRDNYDESKLDMKLEKEVLDYLVTYGHNSKDVKDALDKVKQAQTLRKDFSANVTHELKSPLTSINGYAEMIASGIATHEESQRFAEIINQQGNRLLKMIDETIQLSKFDNNYVKTERFTQFEISKLILESLSSIEQFAKKRKVELIYEPKSIQFYGNEKLIEDLIRNLTSNGVKYSKPTGGFLKIDTSEDLESITLKFSDNGIGIDEESQKRVFERFYVVNKSRDSKTGTGLGLSLVKNITHMHKGIINLQSELGKGSIFTITLPKLSEKDYL